jgi:hypothetical protein
MGWLVPPWDWGAAGPPQANHRAGAGCAGGAKWVRLAEDNRLDLLGLRGKSGSFGVFHAERCWGGIGSHKASRGPSALRYSTGKCPGCLGTALRLRKRRGCFGRNRRTAAANRPDQRPEKAASRFSFGSRLQPEHQFAPAGGAEDEVVAPGSPAGMGEAQQRSGSAASSRNRMCCCSTGRRSRTTIPPGRAIGRLRALVSR